MGDRIDDAFEAHLQTVDHSGAYFGGEWAFDEVKAAHRAGAKWALAEAAKIARHDSQRINIKHLDAGTHAGWIGRKLAESIDSIGRVPAPEPEARP